MNEELTAQEWREKAAEIRSRVSKHRRFLERCRWWLRARSVALLLFGFGWVSVLSLKFITNELLYGLNVLIWATCLCSIALMWLNEERDLNAKQAHWEKAEQDLDFARVLVSIASDDA